MKALKLRVSRGSSGIYATGILSLKLIHLVTICLKIKPTNDKGGHERKKSLSLGGEIVGADYRLSERENSYLLPKAVAILIALRWGVVVGKLGTF